MTGKLRSLIKSVFILCVLMVVVGGVTQAQTLDPSLIEQFRKQTAGSTEQKISSPLDRAREQEFYERQRLQQEEKKETAPSLIEEDYRSRLPASDIKQFGYDIFKLTGTLNDVVTGRVPDSYILGVGDELVISFQGSKSETLIVNVDREGRVVIPDVKPLSVSGLSLGDFKAALRKQVSDSLIGTEVYVSLATMRMISVLVAGEVERPGIVRATSLASPLDVLMMAGGIHKMGSLRNLQLVRGNGSQRIDLYNLLVGAKGNLPVLQDGDKIIVPTIGATIALAGAVIRPGIYELPKEVGALSAKEALQLSGGTIRPRGYAFSHIKMDEQGQQFFETLDPTSSMQEGEIILATLKENAQTGRVELLGHVKAPGVRSLAGTSTVRQLLGSLQNLEDDPYLLFGVIDRIDAMTRTRQLIAFNPGKVILEDQDITLKDQDRVVFLGRNDVDFLTSNQIRQVIFTGKYTPPTKPGTKQCTPVRKLARIIADTQSDRFATAVRAVFVRKEKAREQKQETARRDSFDGPVFTDNSPTGQAAKARSAEDKKRDIKQQAQEEEEACPAVYRSVNNLLSFTLEYVASVDGAVRLPGVYPVVNHTPVSSLLSISGGTSNNADMSRIEITDYRQDSKRNRLVMKREYIDASQTPLRDVTISPGGGVRVSSLPTDFETGAVLLSGEFSQPGVYTIRKGEKLSTLIRRAGGLTIQAYPYGAIFTRIRVKQLQQDELRQTSRRLRSAMISASVKKNIDADSLLAAQRLTDELANTEVLGRVVIEADPVKLSLDPAKDIVLEPGDTLFMPKRPNFIVTIGDVLNPGALQFIPGKKVADYLDEVGGFSRSADEDRVFVVFPNGVAKPVQLSSWGGDRNMGIPPGSAIVVPTNLNPYDSLSLIREIGDIFRNLAVSAASIAVLVRN